MSVRMLRFVYWLIKWGTILVLVGIGCYLVYCFSEILCGEYEYQLPSGETGRAYGCHSFAGGMKCYKDGEVLLVEKYKIIE